MGELYVIMDRFCYSILSSKKINESSGESLIKIYLVVAEMKVQVNLIKGQMKFFFSQYFNNIIQILMFSYSCNLKQYILI